MKLRPSRRDLITGAAALAAYSQIGDAGAQTARRVLLMGGGVHFHGAAIDMNFAAGQYYGGQLSSLISVSRASGGYATNADGSLTYFNNNVPRIGNGTGLLIEQASTNLVAYSQAPATGGWFPVYGSLANGAGVAPDGSNTAFSFTANGTNNPHYFYSTNTGASATTYAASGYFQAGTERYVSFGLSNYTTGVWVTIDTVNWVISAIQTSGTVTGVSSGISKSANGSYYVYVVGSMASAPPTPIVANAPTATGANPAGTYYTTSGTIVGWGLQFEQLSYPTSYIPTTSGTVTRAADAITASGFLQTALAGAQGSVYAATGPLAGGGSSQCIVFQTNRELLTVSNTSIAMFNGSTALLATLGSGNYTANVLQASAWNSTGRSVVGNLSTVATDTNPVGTVLGNYYLGSLNAGSRFMNGYLQRLAVWQNRLSDAALQALT